MTDNMYVNPDTGYLEFENADILTKSWRNFSGKNNKYDSHRFFHISLTEEEANVLRKDGWNVREWNPTNPSEPTMWVLKVTIDYEIGERYPQYRPRIFKVREQKRPLLLSEDLLDDLDQKIFTLANVEIRPYDWKIQNGNSGRKAMLSSMFFKVAENSFGAKYFQDFDEDD